MQSEGIELYFKATGTTNYLMSTLNIKTKDRGIMYDGAVPLHKSVYNLHEFLYSYINLCSKQTTYYISAILKPESESRPETRTLAKLEGFSKRVERIEAAKPIFTKIITIYDMLFAEFIGTDGRIKSTYRSDTNRTELLKAYEHYTNEVKKNVLDLLD